MNMDVYNQAASNMGRTERGRTERPRPETARVERKAVVEKETTQRAQTPQAAKPQESELTLMRNEAVTNQMIDNTVAEANRQLARKGFRLAYQVHEPTDKVLVTVYDSATNEVIREIPPESRLDVLAKIIETVGLMFDGKH